MRLNLTYKLKQISLLIVALICSNLIGQTNEIGVFLGGSLFKGDVGAHSNEYIILNSKPTFGFQFKRNFNYYFGLGISIKRGELYAHDKYSRDIFELKRKLCQ